MASEGVQCPKCRVANYPGLMGYPRCHRCHEQLRQCRYCVHQSGGLCRLAVAQPPRLEAEEGKPYCEAFASRLTFSRQAAAANEAFGARARIVGFVAGLVVLLVWTLVAVVDRDLSGLRLEAADRVVYTEDDRAVIGFEVLGGPPTGWVWVSLDPAVLEFYSVVAPAELAGSERPALAVRLNKRGAGQCEVVLLRRPDAPPETMAKGLLQLPDGHLVGEAKVLLLNRSVRH